MMANHVGHHFNPRLYLEQAMPAEFNEPAPAYPFASQNTNLFNLLMAAVADTVRAEVATEVPSAPRAPPFALHIAVVRARSPECFREKHSNDSGVTVGFGESIFSLKDRRSAFRFLIIAVLLACSTHYGGTQSSGIRRYLPRTLPLRPRLRMSLLCVPPS